MLLTYYSQNGLNRSQALLTLTFAVASPVVSTSSSLNEFICNPSLGRPTEAQVHCWIVQVKAHLNLKESVIVRSLANEKGGEDENKVGRRSSTRSRRNSSLPSTGESAAAGETVPPNNLKSTDASASADDYDRGGDHQAKMKYIIPIREAIPHQ